MLSWTEGLSPEDIERLLRVFDHANSSFVKVISRFEHYGLAAELDALKQDLRAARKRLLCLECPACEVG